MPVPEDFLAAVVRSATPIALAALGELVVERSGVINIGLEGAISVGAVAAAIAAGSVSPELALLIGAGAGMLVSIVFGVCVTRLAAQQVIAGAAISMLGLGVSATLHRSVLANAGATHIPTLSPLPIPLLARLPVVGDALFNQPAPTYALYILVPAVGLFLYRTVAGIVLRAAGEDASATADAGRNPLSARFGAITFGGLLAGLAGATLVIAQTGVFADGISAGRGFIAIAVVALGGWTVRGVVAGAVLFGTVDAVQYLVQSYGYAVPYNLLLALPYGITLLGLAAWGGVKTAPAALGRALDGGP